MTMGEPESSYQGPPGSWDAPQVQVTISGFQMSEAEITNQQYADFLNAAQAGGLVEVILVTEMGPDQGFRLVFGTSSAPTEYAGKGIYNLDGTRVMKDHDNADGDSNEFTGEIEPENPLNLAYIGYDETRTSGTRFYVKDPRSTDDFDWQELTNYFNYTSTARQLDTSVELNDYAAWNELSDFPNNMPTLTDVQNWPASFVRWYGAKAFAQFYSYDLPTEAEWEYAAQGGGAFQYATDDGLVDGDGTSANWNHLQGHPSQHHVEDVKRGSANPYGLYNMAGNVWEWVEDWYAADFYSTASDPVNTMDSGLKVRRGGSWNYHQSTLKTAARAKDEQFKGNDHFGFRVVSRSSGTAKQDSEQPSDFGLVAVYPNPFRHRATVRWETGSSASARIELVDVLGRTVLLQDRGLAAAGEQTLTIDGSRLAPGPYLIRIHSESQIVVRMIVRIR